MEISVDDTKQTELLQLQKLITENEKLISKYPDDEALKINLKSLMKREELLKRRLYNGNNSNITTTSLSKDERSSINS